MFPESFFPSNFYAPSFFPKVGANVVILWKKTIVGVLQSLQSMTGILRRTEAI